MPKRIHKSTIVLHISVVLLILGLQLQVVDSVVLTPQATRFLSRNFGPRTDTPRGAVQALVVETASPRHVIRPARWVGWALLSTGVVSLAWSIMLKSRKK